MAPLEAMGLEVVETELPFGDIAFDGLGNGGKTVTVGIEFKKLEELIGSLRSERIQGHQAPGMQDYDFRWLMIEGEVHYDKQGRLLKRVGKHDFIPLKGGMGIGELKKRVLGLHLHWGLNPIWSRNRRESLMEIQVLYRTWTDKPMDEHTSHLGIYQPAAILPVSPFRQAVSGPLFPGISLRKSLAVEKAFSGSLRKAANASAETWAKIAVIDKNGDTKRLGMTTAEKIKENMK